MARERREVTDEFKQKIVELHLSGQSQSQLAKEYDLTLSALNGWVRKYKHSGSFKAPENRLIALEKELKQLRMENDILKQAALIMAQK